MPNPTVEDFKEYLEQPPDDSAGEYKLQQVLDRALDIVQSYLGFRYAPYGDAETRTIVVGWGPWLTLPPHEEGSITEIADHGGTVIEGWSTSGTRVFVSPLLSRRWSWGPGLLTVTARWGYGEMPPRIVEVVLEVAVNIWQSRKAGRFSDVIGAPGGGAVGYARALTNQQTMILNAERNIHAGIPV